MNFRDYVLNGQYKDSLTTLFQSYDYEIYSINGLVHIVSNRIRGDCFTFDTDLLNILNERQIDNIETVHFTVSNYYHAPTPIVIYRQHKDITNEIGKFIPSHIVTNGANQVVFETSWINIPKVPHRTKRVIFYVDHSETIDLNDLHKIKNIDNVESISVCSTNITNISSILKFSKEIVFSFNDMPPAIAILLSDYQKKGNNARQRDIPGFEQEMIDAGFEEYI